MLEIRRRRSPPWQSERLGKRGELIINKGFLAQEPSTSTSKTSSSKRFNLTKSIFIVNAVAFRPARHLSAAFYLQPALFVLLLEPINNTRPLKVILV